MERMALASLQQQVAGSSISSSYENISAPLLGDFGAMISSLESLPLVEGGGGTMNKYVHPLVASWLQDNGSSSALSMTDSTHSLRSFLQYILPHGDSNLHPLPPQSNEWKEKQIKVETMAMLKLFSPWCPRASKQPILTAQLQVMVVIYIEHDPRRDVPGDFRHS